MARTPKKNTQEPLGKTLWKNADKLRKKLNSAEYKHIVLGLIFLKYITDAFEELHAKLASGEGSFLNDAHKDMKAKTIIANPPFNDSDWSGELLRVYPRWQYGVPPPATPTSPGCST